MAYSDEFRDNARTYYIRHSVTNADAASYAGVSVPTFLNWKKKAKAEGDNWDLQRSALRMAGGGMGDMTTEILEDFAGQFKMAMEQLKDDKTIPPIQRAETLAKLSDSYVKTMKAASSSNSNLDQLSVSLEVLQDLGIFIQKAYPEFAEQFLEILQPFGTELSKKYG